MIKAIFFDWMKTLADIGELSPTENILDKEEEKELLTKSFEKANIPKDKKEKIKQILEKVDDIILYSDTKEVIDRLKHKYKLAIVSNMFAITNDIVRKNFSDFLNKFNEVSLSTEVGFSKPDKDFFIYTLNKLNEETGLGINPREVLVIGDNLDKDITPALALGMQARIIDRTKQNLKEVLRGLI